MEKYISAASVRGTLGKDDARCQTPTAQSSMSIANLKGIENKVASLALCDNNDGPYVNSEMHESTGGHQVLLSKTKTHLPSEAVRSERTHVSCETIFN